MRAATTHTSSVSLHSHQMCRCNETLQVLGWAVPSRHLHNIVGRQVVWFGIVLDRWGGSDLIRDADCGNFSGNLRQFWTMAPAKAAAAEPRGLVENERASLHFSLHRWVWCEASSDSGSSHSTAPCHSPFEARSESNVALRQNHSFLF